MASAGILARTGSRPSPQAVAAAALITVAAVLFYSSFDFGFRITADQRSNAGFAYTRPFLDWGANAFAIGIRQGRIGHLLSLTVEYAGALIADTPVFPLLSIGVLVAIFGSTFAWVARLSGERVTPGLAAVYTALLPVGLHHWLPNAYPMLFLPVAAAFVARLVLMRSFASLSWWSRAPLLLLVFAGAIVYEMCLAILAAMTAVEAWAWLRARRKGDAARFAGGYVAAVAAMLVAALAAYLAFRLAFPSRYSGNALPVDGLARILPSIARHIVDATAFPHWFAVGTLNLANTGDLLRTAVVAAAIAVAIDRSRPTGDNWRPAMAAGVLIVLAAAVPVASTGKYVNWCIDRGECAYVDSRFSLIGLTMIVFFAAAAVARTKWRWRTFAILAGAAGGVTMLSNLTANDLLREFDRADRMARAHVCSGAPAEADAAMAEELAGMRAVIMRPDWDRERRIAYWQAQIAHVRAIRPFVCWPAGS